MLEIASNVDNAKALDAVLAILQPMVSSVDALSPPSKRHCPTKSHDATTPGEELEWLIGGGFMHMPPWWDRVDKHCKGAWAGKTLRQVIQLALPISDTHFDMALAAGHVYFNGHPVRFAFFIERQVLHSAFGILGERATPTRPPCHVERHHRLFLSPP